MATLAIRKSTTYGDAADTTQACNQPSGYVSDDQDCDDGNTCTTNVGGPTSDMRATDPCQGLPISPLATVGLCHHDKAVCING